MPNAPSMQIRVCVWQLFVQFKLSNQKLENQISSHYVLEEDLFLEICEKTKTRTSCCSYVGFNSPSFFVLGRCHYMTIACFGVRASMEE